MFSCFTALVAMTPDKDHSLREGLVLYMLCFLRRALRLAQTQHTAKNELELLTFLPLTSQARTIYTALGSQLDSPVCHMMGGGQQEGEGRQRVILCE